MSLECAYKDIDYCHSEFHKVNDCICDTSIIVPDTKSDIVKVVAVSASPYISDTKWESGRIIVSGQVKFNVLYIGEEENSRICNLTATAPFSHTVSSDESQMLIPISFINCHNAEYTLINSRKIKVSSLLKLCVAAFKANRINVLTSAKNAQCKSKQTDFFSASVICRKNLPITETVDLPGISGEINCILRTSAAISDYDYKVLNNKAIVKGNVLFCVFYSTDDGVSTSSVTIPFTEVVEAEGLSPNRETTITLTVADCDAVCDTDLSGEYKMIDASLLLTATVTSLNKESITAVNDIFLPRGNLKTRDCTITLQSVLAPVCEEEFFKETLTLNPAQPPMEKILDTILTVIDVAESDGIITSVIEATVLYLSRDSSIPLNSHTSKFSISHKCGFINPVNIAAAVKHSGYVISGENSLELRLSMVFSAYNTQEEKISLFTLCEEAPFTPEKRPSVIVSFVNSEETLWDIAKKYNIPISALASANAIDESSYLTKGTKLIIPR